MVVQEFDGFEAYVRACGEDVSLLGISAGLAAAYLGGIRTQRVYREIFEDRLDAVKICLPDGSTRLYVPYKALWRFSLRSDIAFKSTPTLRFRPFRSLLLESAPLVDSLRSVVGGI